MADLAHAIRDFQSGALSFNDFLAQIDSLLASQPGNSRRLLAILDEEHTNFPLPADVYGEVRRRITRLEPPKASPNGDETRVLTDVGNRGEAPPANRGEGAATAGPEQIKGIGDTLNGRFVLEECLGFGGMGMVYKALDLRKLEASDRKPYIAIKVLNVQFRGHPKSLIALQREAKKAQTLAHPNIVTVYDFDRDGSMVYLTMEYLSGRPLSQVLRAPDFKGMAYAKALPIISGMAKALAYAHERGFVHCDLKPANVFLTDGGEVKVIDFGIARAFQKPVEEAEATVFDPGSLGGMTPTYASVEMLEHRDPDPRDDIYALGCITYELLGGRHPFDRLPATQARSAGLKPKRPRGLGRKPWRALRAALSFDRETRTPTVARFLDGMGGGQRPVAEYVTLATAVLLLAALLVAAIAYFRPSGSERPREPAAPESAVTPPPQAVPPPAASSVGQILASVPCSALVASTGEKGESGKGGDDSHDGHDSDEALRIQGYLPRQFGIARLKEMLVALPGAKDPKLDVREVNDEDCGVIGAFAPYWIKNRRAAGATAIRLHDREGEAELREGDSLMVDITTPAYDSYVTVDYYVLDGSVVHLVPSPRAKANQAPPNHSATIGSLGNWVVSKPFGSELIVLLATPAPLFDGLRPENESRADYLAAVEKQLAEIAAKHGTDRITADFLQVTTRPKP